MESPYFNSLLQHVSVERRYNKELAAAKEEFQAFAGAILENDRNFDARINAFHNWYLLERPLRERGKTPLAYYLEFNANSLPGEEWKRFEELLAGVHSLFELTRSGPGQTVLKDLLSGVKYRLDGSNQTQHLDKGALFNTRLFRHQEQWYFSNYLILHPGGAVRSIQKQARMVRKTKAPAQSFLFQLMVFQGRWERYKQMSAESVYRFDAPVSRAGD